MKIALDFLCDVFYYDATLFLNWRWIGVGTPVGATTPIKSLTRFLRRGLWVKPVQRKQGGKERFLFTNLSSTKLSINILLVTFTRRYSDKRQLEEKGSAPRFARFMNCSAMLIWTMTMIYTHVANKGRSGRKARRTCSEIKVAWDQALLWPIYRRRWKKDFGRLWRNNTKGEVQLAVMAFLELHEKHDMPAMSGKIKSF